jgi:hypothetical protein
MTKDVLYIEVDDEITNVISKIEASSGKVVALVLPKNASILSSTVNMKLLKKAEEAHKKNLVVITTDAGLTALAAMAGLHVAKTLKSKPVLPPKPTHQQEEVITEGELEQHQVAKKNNLESTQQEDVIQLDNTSPISKVPILGKRNKKLAVPDFTSFRMKVFLLVAFLLGSAGFAFYAFIIAPKATITLKTEVSNTEAAIQTTVTTAVKEFDASKQVLPAVMIEKKKTDTEKTPATGKKDVGEKAKGSVNFYNCNKDDKLSDTVRTISVGTVIADTNGNQFVTQAEVDVEPSSYSGNTCQSNRPSPSVQVVAVSSGGQYNLSPRNYNVTGFSTILAKDSDGMGGGTSKVITVVSATDIEGAKSRLAGKSKAAAISELKEQITAEQMLALEETISETPPKYLVSAAVDAEVADFTVSAEVTYAMLKVDPAHIKTLIEASIAEKITDAKQKILDNGLAKKTTQLQTKTSNTEYKMNFAVVAVVGPDIDVSSVASDSAGKSRGEIQKLLSARAGIKEVDITYSPFWVINTPKKASKINVIVEQISVEQ